MSKYLYNDLTEGIIKAFYATCTRLGPRRQGYSEENLVAALEMELEERGFQVRTQVAVPRRYRGQRIGTDFVDLVVDDTIPIEVKNLGRLTRRHRDKLQTYLVDGGWAVGLLLNFGGSKAKVSRVYEASNDPTRRQGRSR